MPITMVEWYSTKEETMYDLDDFTMHLLVIVLLLPVGWFVTKILKFYD